VACNAKREHKRFSHQESQQCQKFPVIQLLTVVLMRQMQIKIRQTSQQKPTRRGPFCCREISFSPSKTIRKTRPAEWGDTKDFRNSLSSAGQSSDKNVYLNRFNTVAAFSANQILLSLSGRDAKGAERNTN
jgi:hypothetical protein